MLHCILGGCGTGKSTKLIDSVRTAIAAEKQVIVLSPEQFSSEAEERLYEQLHARDFNQIRTYSFATLARDILQVCGKASRTASYASEQEKLVYLYEAFESCRKEGLLHQLRAGGCSSEFMGTLYQLMTKLRRSGTTSEQLIAASGAMTKDPRLQRKTSDIGHILLAYERILAEHGRYDSLVNLTEAAELAAHADWFAGTCVFIDEFDSFTGDQYQMLKVILKQSDSTVIALRADDPKAPESGIFLGGNRTYQTLRILAKEAGKQADYEYCSTFLRAGGCADLCAVSAGILRQNAETAAFQRHVHILRASSPEEEADYICAEIARLLTEQDTLRCSDIAIAVKEMDVYAPLIEQAMKRYGLPCYIGTAQGVMHTDLISMFLTLLQILTDGGGWNTEHLLHLCKIPLSGYYADTVSMLEHFCFTWNMDGEDWNKPFYEKDTLSASRSGHFGGERLEKLRVRLTGELTALQKECSRGSVRQVCEALYRFVEKKRFAHQAALEKNGKTLPELKQREFVTLWNLLMSTMDTVVQCFGDQKISFGQLRDTFALLLGSSSFATPPQTLDTVCVVEAQTARFRAPKIVFVPGVCDGVYPAEVAADGMFTEPELIELEAHDIRITRLLKELYSDELLIISRIISAPSERLYLTYPRVNQAQEPTEVSTVIEEILRLISVEEDPSAAEEDAYAPDLILMQDIADLPPSLFTRTLDSVYYHFVRCLRDPSRAQEAAALRRLLPEKSDYANRADRLCAQTDTGEAHVSAEVIKKLLPAPLNLSASAIERYYKCPFSYFCQDVLRLYVPQQTALDPRNIGNFAHYCLEKMLSSCGPAAFESLSEEELRRRVSELSAQFSKDNFSDAMHRDKRFLFQYRKTGESVLQLLLHLQSSLKEGKFVPVGYEVPINDKAEPGKGFPAMRLQDGKILIEGKIDRVDVSVTDDGETIMRVVDYKTGTKSLMPEKISEGLDMQMLIYLYALEQQHAYDGAVPGGVLYMPSGQVSSFQDRTKKTRSADEVIGDFYRMKGLFSTKAAGQMETSLQTVMRPVLSRTDSSTVFTATPGQMEYLQKFVEQKICSMSDELHDGQIPARPCLHLGQSTACSYCSFADLCGKAVKQGITMKKEDKDAATLLAFGEPEDTEEEKEDGAA